MPQSTLREPRILVFDSGVGGLSIYSEIKKLVPKATYIYASDNAAFPYGTKSEQDLIARVDKVLHQITKQHPIDLIVIACNTASTLTLPSVRKRFRQPVVGVVPAIKPAAALSKTQVIGLLATPATVARPYTQALIDEHAPDATVISVGSSELVELAEIKLRGGQVNADQITEILGPFKHHPKSNDMDVLVLACTHFPLLRAEIRPHFPENVQIIDSGEAIARRVNWLLADLILAKLPSLKDAQSFSEGSQWALFTAQSPAVDALAPQLNEFGFSHIGIIEV